MSKQEEIKPGATEEVSRRTFLGAGAAGLASVGLAPLAAGAQQSTDTAKAEQDHSASNPGPENSPLLDEIPTQMFPRRRITEISCPSGTPLI